MTGQECVVCGKPRFLILEESKDPYCFSPLVCSEECAHVDVDNGNNPMSIMFEIGWRLNDDRTNGWVEDEETEGKLSYFDY